jgi:glycosyltransferase involved in cell wall biosynthesis
LPGGPDEILLLDHGDIGGGGQRFALRLADEMRGRGLTARIGCRRGTPLDAWCGRAGIKTIDVHYPALVPWRLRSIAAAVIRTRRLLCGLGRATVVVANHPRVQAYLFAASRGLRGSPPVVNLVHEQDSARRISARFAYRRFGALLVVGANAAGEYESRLPGVPVTKVNNFLPAEYFHQAAARRVLSPQYDEPVLGVLARMIPEKGIAELVDEVAAPVVQPRWRQLLIGAAFQDPSYVRGIERRIGELRLGDRIRLLGEVDDVPAFLGSIDALVVPSTGNEAQPTAIIEALAHGVPVVVRRPLWSSDYEGLPVARYRDPSDLAEALRELPSPPASPAELAQRFGPDQFLAGLDASAQAARARS